MKSICDVLHGQTPNAMYPFLWVHGVESEEELRREVQKIHESGIGGFCVEARPHKDFNGPGWFRDLALLLDEAKRAGMEMWILDDSHFPTGFADGAVKREHPELCKKFLCCKTLDYAGPIDPAWCHQVSACHPGSVAHRASAALMDPGQYPYSLYYPCRSFVRRCCRSLAATLPGADPAEC